MTTKLKRHVESAMSMLKSDHAKVKGLFEKFEKTRNASSKRKIVEDVLGELKIHATIEEEYFYPAVREQIDDKKGMMDEADEEHHVAKVLIAELEAMSGTEEHWEAKFTVLAENIRHHIKEEESEMFRKAKKSNIDFVVLGKIMAELKQKLKKEGVPQDAEARMIQKGGLRGDSPAKNAQRKIQVPLRES